MLAPPKTEKKIRHTQKKGNYEIRSEVNEIENRKTTKKSIQQRAGSLKRSVAFTNI